MSGALNVQWIHGSPSSKHNTDPDLQIHWYDQNTVILRQNKAIDYEAPFLFLLFGAVGVVLALAMSGSELYAAGYFTMAGGVAANYIAKWNGSTWTALGSGVGGD